LSNGTMARIVAAGPTSLFLSFRVQIPQHGIPQQGICSGLIAMASSSRPGDHIGWSIEQLGRTGSEAYTAHCAALIGH